MHVLNAPYVEAFDVDDTLVMWDHDGEDLMAFHTPWNTTERLKPNRKIIDQIKKDYMSGRFIIVWSQAGHEWAKCVLEHLGIDCYVHICMTKPMKYFDDLPAHAWMQQVTPELEYK